MYAALNESDMQSMVELIKDLRKELLTEKVDQHNPYTWCELHPELDNRMLDILNVYHNF